MSDDDRILAQAHSVTSMMAAEAIESIAPTLRARVWAFFEACPEGATDEQAQDFLGMNPSTQRPRRVELCDMGMLVNSGRMALTKSGRLATLWVSLTEEERGTRQGILTNRERQRKRQRSALQEALRDLEARAAAAEKEVATLNLHLKGARAMLLAASARR